MAFDPYSPCPCGSGKKFKWCCQPIHVHVDKAFQQDADGQHEAAVRTMDEAIAANPNNPEIWGRKAELLFANDRLEEAEQALDKAMELNPSYPLGHYLRGRFRHFEGGAAGALLLYRKAVELYDPGAHPMLAEICEAAADCELRLNRPVAARAALQMALKHRPADPELRGHFEQLFGAQSRFPAAARRDYALRSLPPNTPPARREAWQRALDAATTGKLSDAVKAFEQLTEQNGDDAATWYNVGLACAWLGDNAKALQALDRYVALEGEESSAAEAWALAEVLRCGHGLAEQADFIEHSATFPMRNPQPVMQFLGQLSQEGRLIGHEEQGMLSAILVDKVQALTAEHAASQMPRLAAYVMMAGNMLRVWNVNKEAFARVFQEIKQAVGAALADAYVQTGPAHFSDVLSEALAFPVGVSNEEDAKKHMREAIQRYYEETWIHRSRKALDGVAPLDAAGHGTLRKKLRGVIQFLEECSALAGYGCDFTQLRRKLGLEAAPAATRDVPSKDFARLTTAELAALQPETLSDAELEEALQAAVKLDAREVAGRFAQVLFARPPSGERPDRYPLFAQLIQASSSAGDLDAALDFVNAGEKDDCSFNEGRRRNDYELRRAQLHARRGELDLARDVYDRLIERVPNELNYRGSAAEAMLAAKKGGHALRYAEEGLAKARQQNKRDSEAYFLELVSAAKKQSG